MWKAMIMGRGASTSRSSRCRRCHNLVTRFIFLPARWPAAGPGLSGWGLPVRPPGLDLAHDEAS